MNRMQGRKLITIMPSDMPLAGCAWTRVTWWFSRSPTRSLPSGACGVNSLPTLSSQVMVPRSTPLPTSDSRSHSPAGTNWSYVSGWVAGPFGLKLWNTTISTTATTTQSSRFFTRSFIYGHAHFGTGSLGAGQLVLGEGIDLG